MLLDPDRIPDDERTCAWMLVQLRWPDGPVCGGCGHRGASLLRARPRVLSCHTCGQHRSVTAGTPLHGCRISLHRILRAAALLAQEDSISARGLGRALGIDKDSAWRLAHRLRAGLVLDPSRLRPPLTPFAWPLVGRVRSRDVPPHQPAILLQDAERHLGYLASSDPFVLRNWADRHGVALLPAKRLLLNDPAQRLKAILRRTHHGVSSRWVERYAQAVAEWVNTRLDLGAPDLATLQRTLHWPSAGWRGLVPSKPYRLEPA